MEVSFDGACDRTSRGSVATYGFTISGAGFAHEGRGLAVPPFHVRATNNVAEYVGAICALEWLVQHGYTGEVVVRGDSQLVIRQITGEYRVRKEHLKPYHEWLKRLMGRFAKADFRWVPRAQNQRADLLSKLALEEVAFAPPNRPTIAAGVDPSGSESEGEEP